MSHRLALFLSISICALGVLAFLSGTEPLPVAALEPSLLVQSTPIGSVSATAYGIFDIKTGKLLEAHNEDASLPIASVTKLFSGAMILQHASLEDQVSITATDIATEGRAGKLGVGDLYTKRELLWPLMLESSNDAAAALRRTHPALIEQMNRFAVNQNADATQFVDASGLSAQNVSSVADLAKLTTQLHQSEQHLFDITQLSQYLIDGNGWTNNNPFVDRPAYQGGKHGFTYEAGRTGVFIFKEPIRGTEGRSVGYVLLGSDDLETDMETLRDWTQQNVMYQ